MKQQLVSLNIKITVYHIVVFMGDPRRALHTAQTPFSFLQYHVTHTGSKQQWENAIYKVKPD